MGPYPIILIAVLWGWLKGFPRWVYPYLVYAFGFALYLSFVATPGFSIFNISMWDREMWAWRAFIPLGFIVAAALLLSRPTWGPVEKMVKDIWNDWTLIAYGLYGLLPLIIPIVQDETGRSYRFPATAIAAFMMVIGAALSLGMAKSRLRTAVMLAGAFLSILAANVGSSFYWQTHDLNIITNVRTPIAGPIAWGNIIIPSISGSLICTLVLLLIPGVIGIAHWLANNRRSGSTGVDV
jgi:hypothetical protein